MVINTFDQVVVVHGLGQGARSAADLAREDRSVHVTESDLIGV